MTALVEAVEPLVCREGTLRLILVIVKKTVTIYMRVSFMEYTVIVTREV